LFAVLDGFFLCNEDEAFFQIQEEFHPKVNVEQDLVSIQV
jgi:hypothetical protein